MKNYFKKFDFEEKFEIDLSELEKKYLDFQSRFHPDKSSTQDIEESIEINQAYKILSDDFERACYLLFLKGIDIKNDEKAVRLDVELLEEVLELQEKIAEINNKDEIEPLRKKINAAVKLLIGEAVDLLKNSNIKPASLLLIKAKYLKKSLEDLKIRKIKISSI